MIEFILQDVSIGYAIWCAGKNNDFTIQTRKAIWILFETYYFIIINNKSFGLVCILYI